MVFFSPNPTTASAAGVGHDSPLLVMAAPKEELNKTRIPLSTAFLFQQLERGFHDSRIRDHQSK
eukprot:1778398-Amphidinium_carterae.1